MAQERVTQKYSSKIWGKCHTLTSPLPYLPHVTFGDTIHYPTPHQECHILSEWPLSVQENKNCKCFFSPVLCTFFYSKQKEEVGFARVHFKNFFCWLNSPITILFKVEFLNIEVSKIVQVPVSPSGLGYLCQDF